MNSLPRRNSIHMLVPAVIIAAATIPLGGQDEKELEQASDYTLPEVVVTATRIYLPLKDVPLSTTVINRDILEANRTLDVGDILRTHTGLNIKSTSWGGLTTASLRGASSGQVLVVRDGIPAYDAFNGLTDLSLLSLGDIDRIEIVRGPTSHLYGANALGGVINLLTLEPRHHTDITAAYGNFNTQRYRLNTGRGDKKRGAVLSAAVDRSDGWRGNDDFLRHNLTGKFTTTIGKVHGSFTGGYLGSEVGVPGAKPAFASALGNSEVTSLFDRQETDNLYGHLSIEARPEENIHWQLRLHPERNVTLFRGKYIDRDSNTTVRREDRYVAGNIRLSGQVEKPAAADHLLAGFETIIEKGDVLQKAINEDTGVESPLTWKPSSHSSAIWGEFIWHLNRLVIVPGVRLDYHSTYGWHTSPSLGVILNGESNRLRLSAGRAYRAPTFNDLFWPGAGNTELKSEQGTAVEIGLESSILPGIRAVTALFHREVHDMIAWAPTGTGDLWQPANINRHLLQGVEAEIRAGYGPLNARLGYTYLHGRQTNREVVYSDWQTGELRMENITRPAAFIPAHTAGFDITGSIPPISLYLSGEYRSETVNYYPDYTAAPVVTMQEKVLPARTLLNARLTVTAGTLEPFLEVRNLLDVSYSEQFGSTLVDGDYPLPGRTYVIGIRARL